MLFLAAFVEETELSRDVRLASSRFVAPPFPSLDHTGPAPARALHGNDRRPDPAQSQHNSTAHGRPGAAASFRSVVTSGAPMAVASATYVAS